MYERSSELLKLIIEDFFKSHPELELDELKFERLKQDCGMIDGLASEIWSEGFDINVNDNYEIMISTYAYGLEVNSKIHKFIELLHDSIAVRFDNHENETVKITFNMGKICK